jgi:16S rRNA (cytidine1402-2'-O)-methyltransferase
MERAAGHDDTGRGEPTLYVVATPIGNLKDITLRALEVLKSVDEIAAEDTRVAAKLLNHYGISAKKLIALHEHNESRTAPRIVEALAAGRSVALTSDAGTPAFSDPGARLVAAVRDAGYRVVPIPGPNAAAAALSASGHAGPQFLFYGFLPAKAGERRTALETVAAIPHALVFYEAPHRVLEVVSDLAVALGGARRIVIARELTKLFETIHVCELGAAAAWLESDANRTKGEFVLIVEGAASDRDSEALEARRTLEILLDELPVKQAAALAAKITGARKNELYELALRLRKES